MQPKKIIEYIRGFDTDHVTVRNTGKSAKIWIKGYKNGNLQNAAHLTIMFEPNSTVYLASGETERNFRKSHKKYGTVIRALATRAAILGNANKVTHHGMNEERLVLKQHAKKLGLTEANAISRMLRRDPNFLKNLPPPISTQIVRKLGFRNDPTNKNKSVFYRNMNTKKLNEVLNEWRS